VQLVADTIDAGLTPTAALDLAAVVVSAAAQVGEAAAAALGAASAGGTVDVEPFARRGRVLLGRAVATHSIDQVGRQLADRADLAPALGELLADLRIGADPLTPRSNRASTP
jgi:hypothetical protein